MKKNNGHTKQEIERGVKIVKAKKKFDSKKLAGSLTGLLYEEASVIRKKGVDQKEDYRPYAIREVVFKSKKSTINSLYLCRK